MGSPEIVMFCAEFWQVDSSAIHEKLALNDETLPNNSSIRFFMFIAKIEAKFKVRVNDIENITTFGDLFRNIENLS